MWTRLSAFLAVIFFSHYISAQNVIEGRLVKSQGNTPIAYANIGILNTSIGTISNADGSFSLRVPEENLDDSVLFSALGFEKRSFQARSLLDQKDVTVQLAEQVVVLRDVIVSGIKTVRQTAEFGNRHWDAGSIYTDSVAAGSAMALLIENKYPAYNPDISPPYYIGKVKLRISKNTMDEFKIRVRIYEYDSLTGLPGRDLFHESLIITSNISKGWVEADLAPFNVRVEGRTFFLAFEWILDDEARSTILNQYREFKRMFPDKVSVDTMRVGGEKIVYNSWHGFVAGTSFGSASKRFYVDHYKSYYRSNSYGAWKRASFILTAQVAVSNQPIERKRKKNRITE